MKVFLGTCEKSAEHLMVDLIKSLSACCPLAKFYVQAQEDTVTSLQSHFDIQLIYDSSLCAVMGFIEPLKILPSLLKRRRDLKKWIDNHNPDIVIGIDAPDFWLPIEKYAKSLNIYTIHVVSPSVWAWRPGRVHCVAQSVHELFCLFPFEMKYYQGLDIKLRQFPHPLILTYKELWGRNVKEFSVEQHFLKRRSWHLVCAPGSREQEVVGHLPLFLEIAITLASQYDNLAVIIPATAKRQKTIEKILREHKISKSSIQVKIVSSMSEALQKADLALCVSGTATLECALMQVPTIVCYVLASWKKYIFNLFIKTPYIALPNIMASSQILPEKIGPQEVIFNYALEHLKSWLNNTQDYAKVKAGLEKYQQELFQSCCPDLLRKQLTQTLQQVSTKQVAAP